jgi:hypothetical protein
MVSLFNRIIANTMEQTIIFGCLLLYATAVLNPLEWPESHFGHVVRVFIFGIVLFSVGYILGDFFGVPFYRSPGFALTLVAQSILLTAFLKTDLFNILGSLPVNDL